MLKKLFVLLFVFNLTLSHAQTIKTDVLVIGGGASGVAAAVQSARSNVKTMLVAEKIEIGVISKAGEMFTVDADRYLPSGTWGEFRRKLHDVYKKNGQGEFSYTAPLKFDAPTGDSILTQITDTVKKLNVNLNLSFLSIKKDGDGWDVNFSKNGKITLIKAKVVVDATLNSAVALKAGEKLDGYFDLYNNETGPTLYRTSIAAGGGIPGYQYKGNKPGTEAYPSFPLWMVPIKSVLAKANDNLVVTGRVIPAEKNIQYLPMQLQVGQGAGTVAAYCVFFKTTTKNLNVRKIQEEVLGFKGNLLPFADVNRTDTAWRAVQQICVTGLLRGFERNGQFTFHPDSTVNTAEVKPVLTEIYTRAFLWFRRETPAEKFTIGNLLSFISDYTLTEPVLLNKTVRTAWKTQYKFKTDFDLNRPITRREFAVLANKYLNPFARTVDLSGRLVN